MWIKNNIPCYIYHISWLVNWIGAIINLFKGITKKGIFYRSFIGWIFCWNLIIYQWYRIFIRVINSNVFLIIWDVVSIFMKLNLIGIDKIKTRIKDYIMIWHNVDISWMIDSTNCLKLLIINSPVRELITLHC